jgi:hypothetical protein
MGNVVGGQLVGLLMARTGMIPRVACQELRTHVHQCHMDQRFILVCIQVYMQLPLVTWFCCGAEGRFSGHGDLAVALWQHPESVDLVSRGGVDAQLIMVPTDYACRQRLLPVFGLQVLSSW